jgi:molybdopterin adenylyltransferase
VSREVVRIGIVTVSDRASRGDYEDRSGPAIRVALRAILKSPWLEVFRLVPDERPLIEETLKALSDIEGCALIFTTGGTGPSARDVTPEATIAVCEKLLPGFGERMRAASWERVPTAILSRAAAGTRGRCLIVNLPGSPKGARECLEAVFPAIPDCLDTLGGPYLETNETVVRAFRPKP